MSLLSTGWRRRGRGRSHARDQAMPASWPTEPDNVLITGGSSGIGAATACAFAARGARVAVSGRDRAALLRVADHTGGVCIPGDLREPGCPERVVRDAAQALGGLDIVVSNAGRGWSGPFAKMTEDDIDSLLDVNLRAAAHLARAALEFLRPGGGRLVFVGSIAGQVGVPGEAWYSATKAGLGMFADVLRAELRTEGIEVTLVVPGAVDTPYFERRNLPYSRDFPRLISPQVVADAIVAAAVSSRPRETIVIPGWLSWPARLRGSFPGLYRLLESKLDDGDGWRMP